MGLTQRKLKKKTRLEKLDIHIQRLTLFNQNAMHEVGKLAQALRYYADPKVWEGTVVEIDGKEAMRLLTWTGLEDGPIVARKVLNSLGLPWDKFPVKDGKPTDPEQPGFKSVLNSAAEEMRAQREGKEEDDRSQVVGQYTNEGVEELKAGDYKDGHKYLGEGRWENS